MDAEGEKYGVEAFFTSEVAVYLQCVVCKLVLRDPLQISTCGHKMCTPCFKRLKTYAQRENKEFTCPVDRMVIDQSTVFDDKSTGRTGH